MDDKGVQLMEKIKHSQKTVGSLLDEYGSLLCKKKSTDTTGDSGHSVKQSSLTNDVNKHLMDIDLAFESIQQQLKFALKQYLSTPSELPTSADRPILQSDNNQQEDANVPINLQVELSDDIKSGTIEPKLNPTVQALFNGTLPDDFFLHLMSVMGIQECLISNRLVCSFWNELVLERCHNQKSLKLFENFDRLVTYGERLLEFGKSDDASLILKSVGDDLLFEGLETDHEQLINRLHQEDDEEGAIQKEVLTRERKLEASKVLTALFPKVKELVLCTEGNSLINIEHLLQFYAKQLTSLTMTYSEGLDESQGSKLRAFSFPELKSLNTFWFSPEEDQLLTLLPQLESLTMESTEMSLETLLRTGSQLRELNLNSIKSVYTASVAEFSKRSPINNNLRKFSFDYSRYFLQTLEFISLNLTSLECLKLDLRYYNTNVSHLNSLSPYLAPLQQLHSLTLKAPVSFFRLDDNQFAEIKPLPSVRHLKLLLWNYAYFSLKSMDLFSRSLFTAFPNAEQVLIAFAGYDDEEDDDLVHDGLVDADTLAAFEAFAGKHPNLVQLFRTKDMSKFTKLPNAVSPLLGQHRQVYEEYIEEVELFGVTIGKLAASLVTRKGEYGANLKTALRPANRFTTMSNLFQLLESKAFAFTAKNVNKMIEQMVECALTYGPSQAALLIVTSKCLLFLLDCRVVDYNEGDETAFLDPKHLEVFSFLEMLLKLVEHYITQRFNEKELLLQLCKRMVKILKFDTISDEEQLNEFEVFKIMLKLANHYQTQQLNVLDNEEKLLLQIDNLVDGQLKKYESANRLNAVIRQLIGLQIRVYRVEMARALTRCGKSAVRHFKVLSGEADSDSSDGSSSSSESEPEL